MLGLRMAKPGAWTTNGRWDETVIGRGRRSSLRTTRNARLHPSNVFRSPPRSTISTRPYCNFTSPFASSLLST
jgi:hypothetical protein